MAGTEESFAVSQSWIGGTGDRFKVVVDRYGVDLTCRNADHLEDDNYEDHVSFSIDELEQFIGIAQKLVEVFRSHGGESSELTQ